MTDIFSSHAPTGALNRAVVSPNEYSAEGRNIGFPANFSVYVNKISQIDGSQTVTETRSLTDLVGSRLYLYHRPLINAAGIVTDIVVSDGTLNQGLTNARQAYVVFSAVPSSSTFTITYSAAPDYDSMWHLNVLQDDVMEIQKTLGTNNNTGYAGIRNLAFGIFDSPSDPVLASVAQRSIYLSHLAENIVIGSTNDPALSGVRGLEHTIQIGRGGDSFIADVSSFSIKQSDSVRSLTINLGNRTGDYIYYSGQMSGEGPLTIGGPAWPNYSGVLGGTVTTGYYNNSMLRVNGDVAVLGDLQAVGSVTIVNLTGEVSTVIGDFTITDELEVRGPTRLIGYATTNRITCQENIRLYGDLTAINSIGNGGAGQSLVDGLDASEVAHSYNTVIRKVLPNTVLNGQPFLGFKMPISGVYTYAGFVSGQNLAGDSWQFTGFATANAGPSGAHPNIIQCNFTDYPLPAISGLVSVAGVTGSLTGVWSPGLMDPGSLYIHDLNNGFISPVYGYTIESGSSSVIYKMNVFSPEMDSNKQVQANDALLLYNPYSRPYNFITAVGGVTPTFSVVASATYPFEVSFENQVRKMSSSSTSVSMVTALDRSITGLAGTSLTGIAYIFAKNNTDPENPPSFLARNIPYRMPGETAIGQVVAHYSGSQWHILDTTSYRPGAVYDSSWIPITTVSGYAGRVIGGIPDNGKVVYFKHDLGCDVDIYRTNVELYLGTLSTYKPQSWDQAQPLANSIMSKDRRSQFGFSGAFSKIPVTNTHYSGESVLNDSRDASLCYLDGSLIGIHIDSKTIESIPGSSAYMSYIRLVVRRDA